MVNNSSYHHKFIITPFWKEKKKDFFYDEMSVCIKMEYNLVAHGLVWAAGGDP